MHVGLGRTESLLRHDIGWVVFPTRTRLMGALEANPDWRVLYSDNIATAWRARRLMESHTVSWRHLHCLESR
jgi:hypothetical protein